MLPTNTSFGGPSTHPTNETCQDPPPVPSHGDGFPINPLLHVTLDASHLPNPSHDNPHPPNH